jgi:hypothetical protein
MSGKMVVVIGGMSFEVGDGEERVRDIDLAVKLEYAHPRQIRRLIKAMMERGELTGVLCRTAAVQQTGQRGGAHEETTEYWLTEAQALKVSARSGTRIANQILDHVISVFLLVRKEWRRRRRRCRRRRRPRSSCLKPKHRLSS